VNCSHHLTLHEAADLAQNRPLWRMMSTYGATQSWVACQKRRRRVTVLWKDLNWEIEIGITKCGRSLTEHSLLPCSMLGISCQLTWGTEAVAIWEQYEYEQRWTIWSGSHWRPGVITNGWPCFIVCSITWCLLLQLISLFRFSGRTAEDQVMMKCIKFLTLGPMSTSTPSFQQLYACGTLYLHLWSILIHFSPSKQASVFITDTDSRDIDPCSAWYSAYRGMHFIGRWRWWILDHFTFLLNLLLRPKLIWKPIFGRSPNLRLTNFAECKLVLKIAISWALTNLFV